MLPDIFGFPTIMNMVDDEDRDNEEMVQLAADRVRMVSPPERCPDCGRRLIRCDGHCQVIVESDGE